MMTATPPTPKTARAVPDTFRSCAALADAIDAVFADVLAQELADHVRPPIVLPTVDTLIAQARIVTGPAPVDTRLAPAVRAAGTAGRWTARAAWWLLGVTATGTVALLRGALVTAWRLAVGTRTAPAATVRTSDFLTATSDYIAQRGWRQFGLESDRGVCVLGAQRNLLRTGIGTRDTARQATAYLLQATGARTVPGWNDKLTRQQTQIHTGLRDAAALARANGD